MSIENRYIFIGIAVALVSYILYMMIRSRHGERPGSKNRDIEL